MSGSRLVVGGHVTVSRSQTLKFKVYLKVLGVLVKPAGSGKLPATLALAVAILQALVLKVVVAVAKPEEEVTLHKHQAIFVQQVLILQQPVGMAMPLAVTVPAFPANAMWLTVQDVTQVADFTAPASPMLAL